MYDAVLNVGVNQTELFRQINRVLNDPRLQVGGHKGLAGINARSFTQPLGNIRGELGEFEKSLAASNARVIAFGLSAGSIYAVNSALKYTVRSAIDVEKRLNEISVIMGRSTKGMESFGNELFKVANQMGASFEDASRAALELSRQGLSVSDTLKRTADALLLTRISGLDAVDSVSAITAALNSFNSVALDSTKLVNQLAAVDTKFAVSSSDLAEALRRVGSTADDAGVSIEQLVALVTAAQQTTQRGGAVIGNALKSIFTRLERPRVLEQLAAVGVAFRNTDGSARPMIAILSELASKYDELTDSQQAHIAELVGGVYQMNILKAILRDTGKEFSFYTQALQTANAATDDAQRRSEELNNTLSAKLQRTLNNLTQIGAQVGQLTFAPAINKLLNSLQGVTDSDFASKIGQSVFAGLGKVFAGPGITYLTLVFAQLGKRLVSYINDALQQVSGLGAGYKNTVELQKAGASWLDKQQHLMRGVLSNSISVNEAQQQFIKYLQVESSLMQALQIAAKEIAVSMNAMGFKAGVKGAPLGVAIPQTKAAGHIPSAIERMGALAGGYQPGNIKQMVLEGRPIIYNDAERVVPVKSVFPNARSNSAFIIPPAGSEARRQYDKKLQQKNINPQIFAGGFVPNLALSRKVLKPEDVEPTKKQIKLIESASLEEFATNVHTRYLVGSGKSGIANFEGSRFALHALTPEKAALLDVLVRAEYENMVNRVVGGLFNLPPNAHQPFSIAANASSFGPVKGFVFEDAIKTALATKGSRLSKDVPAGSVTANEAAVLAAFSGSGLLKPGILGERGAEIKGSTEEVFSAIRRGQANQGAMQDFFFRKGFPLEKQGNRSRELAKIWYEETPEEIRKGMGSRQIREAIVAVHRRLRPEDFVIGKAMGFIPNLASSDVMRNIFNSAHRLPNASSIIAKLREGTGLSNGAFIKAAQKLGVNTEINSGDKWEQSIAAFVKNRNAIRSVPLSNNEQSNLQFLQGLFKRRLPDIANLQSGRIGNTLIDFRNQTNNPYNATSKDFLSLLGQYERGPSRRTGQKSLDFGLLSIDLGIDDEIYPSSLTDRKRAALGRTLQKRLERFRQRGRFSAHGHIPNLNIIYRPTRATAQFKKTYDRLMKHYQTKSQFGFEMTAPIPPEPPFSEAELGVLGRMRSHPSTQFLNTLTSQQSKRSNIFDIYDGIFTGNYQGLYSPVSDSMALERNIISKNNFLNVLRTQNHEISHRIDRLFGYPSKDSYFGNLVQSAFDKNVSYLYPTEFNHPTDEFVSRILRGGYRHDAHSSEMFADVLAGMVQPEIGMERGMIIEHPLGRWITSALKLDARTLRGIRNYPNGFVPNLAGHIFKNRKNINKGEFGANSLGDMRPSQVSKVRLYQHKNYGKVPSPSTLEGFKAAEELKDVDLTKFGATKPSKSPTLQEIIEEMKGVDISRFLKKPEGQAEGFIPNLATIPRNQIRKLLQSTNFAHITYKNKSGDISDFRVQAGGPEGVRRDLIQGAKPPRPFKTWEEFYTKRGVINQYALKSGAAPEEAGFRSFSESGILQIRTGGETYDVVAGGHVPNLARIPFLTPLIGRVATNIAHTQTGFSVAALGDAADFVEKFGFKEAISNIIKDKPLYESRQKRPAYLHSSDMQVEPVTGLDDFAFRKMFGLPAREPLHSDVKIRQVPSQKNTFALGGKHLLGAYSEIIGQTVFGEEPTFRRQQGAQLVGAESLAKSFDLGTFNVSSDFLKQSVRFRDTWDFALHGFEQPPSFRLAAKELFARITGASTVGNYKDEWKQLFNQQNTPLRQKLVQAGRLLSPKVIKKQFGNWVQDIVYGSFHASNKRDKFYEFLRSAQSEAPGAIGDTDTGRGWASSHLTRYLRHLITKVTDPVTFVGQLPRPLSEDFLRRQQSAIEYSMRQRERAEFFQGFVPNLANAFNHKNIQDAFRREMDAGYAPAQVKFGFDPRIGPLVYNTTEGSPAQAVDAHVRSGKNMRQIQTLGSKARGHIPNLADEDTAFSNITMGLGMAFSQAVMMRQGGYKAEDLRKLDERRQILEQTLEEERRGSNSARRITAIEQDIIKVKQDTVLTTQQKGRYERLQNRAIAASFAAPFLGGTAQSLLGESAPKLGGLFADLGNAVSLAATTIFAIPGPIGVAAGGAVAALSLFSQGYKTLTAQAPELEKKLATQKDNFERANNAINQFTQVFDKLTTASQSQKTSAETIVKLEQQYAAALAEVPEEYRKQVASAASAQDAQEAIADVLLKEANKIGQLDLATTLTKKLDTSRGLFADTSVFGKINTEVGQRTVQSLAGRLISTSSNPEALSQRIASTAIASVDDWNNLVLAAEKAGEIGNDITTALLAFGARAGDIKGFWDNADKDLQTFVSSLRKTAQQIAESSKALDITKIIRQDFSRFDNALKQSADDASKSIVALTDSIYGLASQSLRFTSQRATLRNTQQENLVNTRLTLARNGINALGAGISETLRGRLEDSLGLGATVSEGGAKFRRADTEAVNALFESVRKAIESNKQTAEQIINEVPANPEKERRSILALQNLAGLRANVEGQTPQQVFTALMNFTRENGDILELKLGDVLNQNQNIIEELTTTRAQLSIDFKQQLQLMIENNRINEQARRIAQAQKTLGGAQGLLNPELSKDSLLKVIRGLSTLSTRGDELPKGRGALDFLKGIQELGVDLKGQGAVSLRELAIQARAKELTSIGSQFASQIRASAFSTPAGSIERFGLLGVAQEVEQRFSPTEASQIARDQILTEVPLSQMPKDVAKLVDIASNILREISVPQALQALSVGDRAENEIFNTNTSSINKEIAQRRQLISTFENEQKEIRKARDITSKSTQLIIEEASSSSTPKATADLLTSLYNQGDIAGAVKLISKSSQDEGRRERARKINSDIQIFSLPKLEGLMQSSSFASIRSADTLGNLYRIFNTNSTAYVHDTHVEDAITDLTKAIRDNAKVGPSSGSGGQGGGEITRSATTSATGGALHAAGIGALGALIGAAIISKTGKSLITTGLGGSSSLLKSLVGKGQFPGWKELYNQERVAVGLRPIGRTAGIAIPASARAARTFSEFMTGNATAAESPVSVLSRNTSRPFGPRQAFLREVPAATSAPGRLLQRIGSFLTGRPFGAQSRTTSYLSEAIIGGGLEGTIASGGRAVVRPIQVGTGATLEAITGKVGGTSGLATKYAQNEIFERLRTKGFGGKLGRRTGAYLTRNANQIVRTAGKIGKAGLGLGSLAALFAIDPAVNKIYGGQTSAANEVGSPEWVDRERTKILTESIASLALFGPVGGLLSTGGGVLGAKGITQSVDEFSKQEPANITENKQAINAFRNKRTGRVLQTLSSPQLKQELVQRDVASEISGLLGRLQETFSAQEVSISKGGFFGESKASQQDSFWEETRKQLISQIADKAQLLGDEGIKRRVFGGGELSPIGPLRNAQESLSLLNAPSGIRSTQRALRKFLTPEGSPENIFIRQQKEKAQTDEEAAKFIAEYNQARRTQPITKDLAAGRFEQLKLAKVPLPKFLDSFGSSIYGEKARSTHIDAATNQRTQDLARVQNLENQKRIDALKEELGIGQTGYNELINKYGQTYEGKGQAQDFFRFKQMFTFKALQEKATKQGISPDETLLYRSLGEQFVGEGFGTQKLGQQYAAALANLPPEARKDFAPTPLAQFERNFANQTRLVQGSGLKNVGLFEQSPGLRSFVQNINGFSAFAQQPDNRQQLFDKAWERDTFEGRLVWRNNDAQSRSLRSTLTNPTLKSAYLGQYKRPEDYQRDYYARAPLEVVQQAYDRQKAAQAEIERRNGRGPASAPATGAGSTAAEESGQRADELEKLLGAINQLNSNIVQLRGTPEDKTSGKVEIAWPTLNVAIDGTVNTNGSGSTSDNSQGRAILIATIKNEIYEALGRQDLKVPLPQAAGQQGQRTFRPH